MSHGGGDGTPSGGLVELEVIDALATSPSFAEAAPVALRLLGEQLGCPVAAAWNLDAEGEALRCVAFWAARSSGVEAFRELTMSISFAPGAGLPGRVWASGEPMWIEDIAGEPNFLRAKAASEGRLVSGFSFPVVSGQDVLGTIELFSQEHRSTDRALLQRMTALGRAVGRLVEAKRAQDQARHAESLKTAMLESAIDAVVGMDHRGRIIEFNPAAERMFDRSREDVIGQELAGVMIPERMRDRHRRGLARYMETGEGPVLDRRVELAALRSDATEFQVELSISRIAGSEPPLFTGFIRDITERKREDETLQLLAMASAALDESLELEETLETLARLAVSYLADGCMVDVLEEDGTITRAASASADPTYEPVLAELRQHTMRLDGPHPIARVMRTGRSEVIQQITESFYREVSETDEYLAALHGWPARSVAIVPMKRRGKMLGTMALASFSADRVYGDQDLSLIEELARRAANAIDNARLFRARTRIARTLQRSLLPPHLPKVPGAELAAKFQPGAAEGEVGGDFYDVFEFGSPGSWLFAIGDVSGRGAEAATTSALARHTIRVAALQESDAAGMLRVLNEALRSNRADLRFCTVALGLLTIDGGDTSLSLATAGHPLPLLLQAGGRVRPVGRPGTILGVVPDPFIETEDVALAPRDTLVFYTNGVAGSGAADSLGMAQLTSVVAGCAHMDAAGTADCIERAVVDARLADPRDDAALLVVRITGQTTARVENSEAALERARGS
jgi:PAS domain S-box-containing protein